MNRIRTPTLDVRQATAICGSLSETTKMPCYGYSLPARECRIGKLLKQIPGATCAHCYALRGRYLFPVVRTAMEKRLASITNPRWVEGMTTLIGCSREPYFRWHDSGDVQNIMHLEKILVVCTNLPDIRFWLPTREYQTIEAWRRMGGVIPANLCIRYSTHLIDGRPPLRYRMPTSMVCSSPKTVLAGAYRCPAGDQRNACRQCRACWDRAVRIVAYQLKWAGRKRGVDQ